MAKQQSKPQPNLVDRRETLSHGDVPFNLPAFADDFRSKTG